MLLVKFLDNTNVLYYLCYGFGMYTVVSQNQSFSEVSYIWWRFKAMFDRVVEKSCLYLYNLVMLVVKYVQLVLVCADTIVQQCPKCIPVCLVPMAVQMFQRVEVI